MIQINTELINILFDKAVVSERKRINYDLRTSASDNSQRMLNALLPGTVVPIHRHPLSNENVLLLQGKLVEILYEEESLGSDMPMGMDAQNEDFALRVPPFHFCGTMRLTLTVPLISELWYRYRASEMSAVKRCSITDVA